MRSYGIYYFTFNSRRDDRDVLLYKYLCQRASAIIVSSNEGSRCPPALPGSPDDSRRRSKHPGTQLDCSQQRQSRLAVADRVPPLLHCQRRRTSCPVPSSSTARNSPRLQRSGNQQQHSSAAQRRASTQRCRRRSRSRSVRWAAAGAYVLAVWPFTDHPRSLLLPRVRLGAACGD